MKGNSEDHYPDAKPKPHDYPDYPDNQGNQRVVAATELYLAMDAIFIRYVWDLNPSQNDSKMKLCNVRKESL